MRRRTKSRREIGAARHMVTEGNSEVRMARRHALLPRNMATRVLVLKPCSSSPELWLNFPLSYCARGLTRDTTVVKLRKRGCMITTHAIKADVCLGSSFNYAATL